MGIINSCNESCPTNLTLDINAKGEKLRIPYILLYLRLIIAKEPKIGKQAENKI